MAESERLMEVTDDDERPARQTPKKSRSVVLAAVAATCLVGIASVGLAARGRAPEALDEEAGPSAAHVARFADDGRPDIVLVFMDDVGLNDLWRSTDLPKPTEMSKLVRDGVELTSYYGQSLCSPARATLMTGKFAHKIGFSDQQGGVREVTAYSNFSVPLGHDMLPQGMKRLGYQTHAIGKWNIGHCNVKYMPWQRGFDTFVGYFTDGIGYTDHGGLAFNGSEYEGTYTTALFTERAEKVLHDAPEDAPLFMWLAYHGMHDNDGVTDADTCAQTGDDDDDAIFMERGHLPFARFNFGCGLRAIDRAWASRVPRRGAAYDGLMHHVDWFGTFVHLGGGDVAALTTFDSSFDTMNHWPQIAGAPAPGPRGETIIFAASDSTASIRSGAYKYTYNAVNVTWFMPSFNGTIDSDPARCDGSSPATQLFDVKEDPREEIDLATDPDYKTVLEDMNALWEDALGHFWVPTFPFASDDALEAPQVAFHQAGGYVTHWGCTPSERDE
ncbi:sulfuric ester hydrolase [Aureococcus anophagefferens]|nr:sulfuric ester hydrolase [Aureococcus anophagefferens]